jgi:hypothetical protein
VHQAAAPLKVADGALSVVNTLQCLPNPCNGTMLRHLLTMSLSVQGIAVAAADPQEVLQTTAEKHLQSAVLHEIDP